jgi:mono/diheme cytochrome c family protein
MALASLLQSDDKKVAELAARVESAMSWPNKPGDTTPPLKPLSDEQQKLFEGGKVVFAQICSQCHQPSGLGLDGVAPPLVDSEWLLGKDDRVVRIVLNGIHGPIKVGRKTMDLEMPGLGALTDEQIASVLTYLRREWGHEGSPIETKAITTIRKQNTSHGEVQWTADELMKLK